MSATATDHMDVEAATWQDAEDKAMRRWADSGCAVLLFTSSVPIHGRPGWFRVTAVVRLYVGAQA